MTKDALIQMRVGASKKAVWVETATSAGLSLSAWLERAADDEVMAVRAEELRVQEEERQRERLLRDLQRKDGR